MDTQEFLRNSIGHLSQKTHVEDFDSTQNSVREKGNLRPIKTESVVKHVFPVLDDKDPGKDLEDSALVFVSQDRWNAFQEWHMKHE